MTPTAQLIHGDCLDVLPTLTSGTIDMAFCDLPYGVTVAAWDVLLNNNLLWNALRFAAKQDASYLFTATQPFASHIVLSNVKQFRYDIIWNKIALTGHLSANRQPLRQHEHILVFGQGAYNPQKSPGKPYKMTSWGVNKNYSGHKMWTTDNASGDRHPKSIYSLPTDKGLHPTQKPVPLLRYLIRTYSNPGDTILDPTCGSATTIVAALLEGRHSIGIEKDATIFANAQERVMAVQRSLRRK